MAQISLVGAQPQINFTIKSVGSFFVGLGLQIVGARPKLNLTCISLKIGFVLRICLNL